MTDRREELVEGATDYALERGLIDLSLRPLAAELGTSDRMLLYHFRDKDDLVASVVRCSTARSASALTALAPSVDPEQAVLDLAEVLGSPAVVRCARLYSEASLLGVLGREPYADLVTESNQAWLSALAGHLAASGVAAKAARRMAGLVDATFMGLSLDLPLDDGAATRQVVRDLARAVGELAS